MKDFAERKYRSDVSYEIWRSGGNPDAIDYDRVSESFHNGLDSNDAARRELNVQKRKREYNSSGGAMVESGFDEQEQL